MATVLIKKYGNRRLYDTGDSRYVTLDELATKIRSGMDLRVVDAQSGEDLTQGTLTQIVLETGNAAKFLPVQLLTQMIRLSDDALAEFFSRYVTSALDLYLQAKRGVQTISSYNPLTQIPMAAGDALARMWMGGFGGAPYQQYPGQQYPGQQYPGYTAPPPPYPVAPAASDHDDVDDTVDEPTAKKRARTEPSDTRTTEQRASDRASDRADDVAEMRRELEELKQVLRESLPKRKKKKS